MLRAPNVVAGLVVTRFGEGAKGGDGSGLSGDQLLVAMNDRFCSLLDE